MIFTKKTIQVVSMSLIILVACNQSDDVVTSNAKEGAFLSVKGSTGQLAGAPESGVELKDAEIDFELANLTYKPTLTNGADDVSELVVKKTFKGKTVEIDRTSEKSLLVEYSQLSDFLDGFDGVTPSSLRVGDVVVFQTYIIMKDGRELVNNSAALNIQVSCVADLSGTYSVTNTSCPNDPDFPITVTITKNSDGSYHLTSADGGFLHACTANVTLINSGDIVEQCGTILPSDKLDFVQGYNIGNITGGTWDAATGILILNHTQEYFTARPGEWTSTYVRQ
jgi:hypothetical protein